MIKVSTTGMMVSLKTDWRFPNTGQQGHGSRNTHMKWQSTTTQQLFLQDLSNQGIISKKVLSEISQSEVLQIRKNSDCESMMIADNISSKTTKLEKVFFFAFPFLFRNGYCIVFTIFLGKSFLINRAKSFFHCFIVGMGIDGG